MTNLEYIVATTFANRRYPQILKIAPDDGVMNKFIDLLEKYSDNRSIIVNIEEGHFKFWLYEEVGRQIRYVWGKIGGTSSIKDIPESRYDAMNKRRQKIAKGYQELI